MADDTDQVNQSDPQLLPHPFTTVFEYLINVSGFELPFILVLLDADDSVIGNKIVQNSEHETVLSAMDFVCSEGADEGLCYPMHMMVRDANGNVAYGYMNDLDAQPEIGVCVATERKTGKLMLLVLFMGITQWTQPTPGNGF